MKPHTTYLGDDERSESLDPIEKELRAAKAAAGFEFLGLLVRLSIVPPQNTMVNTTDMPPTYVTDRSKIPPRETWYADSAQVFDNLYFLGGKIHSAWALTTSEGVLLIDTVHGYNSEELILGGMQRVGLKPDDIRFAIISHAHADHIGGAELLQNRGARIVMGEEDWLMVEKYPNRYSTMAPARDISVANDETLVVGDSTIQIYTTPGHTTGTLSLVFTVFDNGEPIRVAYSGGTAMNFLAKAENYQRYIDSQDKMAGAARLAQARVILSNHSEFDSAFTKTRILRCRRVGEPNPFVLGEDWVQRYFQVGARCARAAQMRLERTGGGPW